MSLASANLLLFIVGYMCLYPLPSLIAYLRGHRNFAGITCLNLLLGWTFIGWVVSLVWALTDGGPRRTKR